MRNHACLLAILLVVACTTDVSPRSATLGGQLGTVADDRPVQTGQKLADSASNTRMPTE